MLKLEKRPQPSKEWVYLSPILAVVITMIVGGVLFALLTDQIIIEFNSRYLPKVIIGEDPFEAIRIIFWDPLFDPNFSNNFKITSVSELVFVNKLNLFFNSKKL